MQAIIGSTLLSSKVVQPTKKPFEIYDSRLIGFTLRVQPSGVRSYYARFGRNRRGSKRLRGFSSRSRSSVPVVSTCRTARSKNVP